METIPLSFLEQLLMDSNDDVAKSVSADVASFPLERIGSTENFPLPTPNFSAVSSPEMGKNYPLIRAIQSLSPLPLSPNSIFDNGVQMLEAPCFQELEQSSSDISSYMSSLEEAMAQPQEETDNPYNPYNSYNPYDSSDSHGYVSYCTDPNGTHGGSSKMGGDMRGDFSFNNSVDESSLTTFLEEFKPIDEKEFCDFKTPILSSINNETFENFEEKEKNESRNNLKRTFESQECQVNQEIKGFTILTESGIDNARSFVGNSKVSPRRVLEREEVEDRENFSYQRTTKRRVLEDNNFGGFEKGCNGVLNIERKSSTKSKSQHTTKWRTIGGNLHENRVVMSSQIQNSLESQLERLAEDWKEATTVGCLTMASIPYSLLRMRQPELIPQKTNRLSFFS